MRALSDPLHLLLRLDTQTRTALDRLRIHSGLDLLYHFPTRYADAASFKAIANLAEGEQAVISGVIQKIKSKKSFRANVPLAQATVEDQSGSLLVTWFNQPYLARMYPEGTTVTLSGRVAKKDNKLVLINPDINRQKALSIDSHDTLFGSNHNGTLTPIYPETKGLSSRWLQHAIAKLLTAFPVIDDPLPESLRISYNLPALRTALVWIHTPRLKDDALIARKRFSFEEIFLLQLARLSEREQLKQTRAYEIIADKMQLATFIKRFPFPLTQAQENAIEHIITDLEQSAPMSRLLEGDVGSGKTAVAAAAAYATVMNRPLKHPERMFGRPSQSDGLAKQRREKQTFGNLQVAYMAPTELLATQHFESFIEYFRGSGLQIGLITGSGCRKFPTKVASSKTPWTTISRTQLSKWIANGEIPMVIGTHTLIQKSLTFKHLALAIIDEQHRFGLEQRKKLAKKDAHFPHLLSMTATPIPRTLALTVYGDLDLSVLDQMPAGRKPVHTSIVVSEERERVYKEIRKELAAGRQLYVICPRIDEPDPTLLNSLQARSVAAEARRLQKDIFPEYTIGILHSKMTKEKKECAMQDFAEKKADILVATSVVEVGINVPNATLIIIEGAERFGLAQLHQLRGRVARSTHQAYCYLFADAKSEKTAQRLQLFTKAKNGFELAEYDLQLRGAGEMTGTKQWGMSDLAMDALKNPKLVEAAREEARKLLTEDLTLAQYPLLQAQIAQAQKTHFE